LRDVNLVGATDPGPPQNAGDLIWRCAPGGDTTKAHMMTSTSLVAYGHVDFSPRQKFENVNRVCWDQNWTEMGGRKWTQVTIVPEDLFQANNGRMEYVTQALQSDVAVNGLKVTGNAWMLEMLRASTTVQVGQEVTYQNDLGFQTTDKARRFRQCAIDQGDGTVRLELERENGTEVRIAPGSFPTGPARVIFQDVTYDSLKGSIPSDQAMQTNTWHWDNIQINADASSELTDPVAPVAAPPGSLDGHPGATSGATEDASATENASAGSPGGDPGLADGTTAAVTLAGLALVVAAVVLVSVQRARSARRVSREPTEPSHD
jgi:hypothetical protein